MDVLTIEDHLEEYCPKCKTKHNQEWDITFDTHKAIMLLECPICEYLVYRKLDVMTSSKHDLSI